MDKGIHEGHRTRMRDRILKDGIESLQPHEVLEYILYAFVPRKDTNEIAHELIDKFGSFSGVLDAEYEQLIAVKGISEVTATFLTSLKGILNYYQLDKAKAKKKVDTLNKVVEYMQGLIGYETKEKAYLLLTNNQSELLATKLLSSGTVDQVGIYIREISELALRYKATGVILCHNHPSGNVSPSMDDIGLTRSIYTALRMINIRLLDHIIISGKKHYSMKFNGDLNEIIQHVETKLGEGFFESQIEWREE